jgi:predicted methyltransferase
MRAFTNSEGQLILSWTVIDREIKRRLGQRAMSATFLRKEYVHHWEPLSEEYEKFGTTVWDVPRRGNWGVHQATYRGNWAPQIARALLELYTKPGELVLDPFVGGGTTLLEAWVLGRPAIGYDVSEFALDLTRSRLDELRVRGGRESLYGLPTVKVEARKGDARTLDGVADESVDFICTHPPYGDAVQYTHDEAADLSRIKDPEEFIAAFGAACKRFFQVLKAGGFCAVLVGDVRKEGQLQALGFGVFEELRKAGFEVEDIVVKTQNQERSTEFYFKQAPMRLRLAHEYLFVFRKPASMDGGTQQ